MEPDDQAEWARIWAASDAIMRRRAAELEVDLALLIRELRGEDPE